MRNVARTAFKLLIVCEVIYFNHKTQCTFPVVTLNSYILWGCLLTWCVSPCWYILMHAGLVCDLPNGYDFGRSTLHNIYARSRILNAWWGMTNSANIWVRERIGILFLIMQAILMFDVYYVQAWKYFSQRRPRLGIFVLLPKFLREMAHLTGRSKRTNSTCVCTTSSFTS